MRLLEGLVELIAPTRCAGCDLPGSVLCDSCIQVVSRFDASQSCPRCAAPFGALVCTECWDSDLPFDGAIAIGELAGPLARAVVLHKDAGERRLGRALGSMLAERASRRWRGWPDVVTWVPPTPAALHRRGFDHAKAIAAPLADALGLSHRALLARSQALDQRELSRAARARNAAHTFTALDTVPSRVLLVDDVLTTGATLAEAADVLRSAGAVSVRAAVVARSW